MIVLGIESTAHTFGVAILKDKEVLANVWDAFRSDEGGMIPAEVGKHHVKVCDAVLKKALSLAKERAGVRLNDVQLVAFSQGPGMGNALKVGATCARSLSLLCDVPLIGVNHCIAHLEVGRLVHPECKDPVLLYASGANTQVIAYDAGKYRVFGETLDNGIGNFIDSFGRLLGLGFPAGPKIERLASQGKTYIPLPYVVKGMDVSFGGIFTKLRHLIEAEKKKVGHAALSSPCALSGHALPEQFVADLSFSVQETVFAMLVEVSERALTHVGKRELLLGGGVACNKRLQEMCRIMCKERGARSFALPIEFNVDNAAMIAWLGSLMHQAGVRMALGESGIRPYERTDDVRVTWRD